MLGLRTTIVEVVLIALIFCFVCENSGHAHGQQHGNGPPNGCTNNPQAEPFLPPCSTIPATTSTTMDPSALQRAHWCRLSNGTYLALGYSYITPQCSICQCTTGHSVRCSALECMPTYCIDNSMPVRKSGQCCTQCAYDVAPQSCVYNGIAFPHGSVLKSVQDQMQCWCQLGNVECRKYIGSIFQGMDFWTDGRAVYIVIIVLCVVLIFGVLLCCSCTLFFYYYYQRNQQTFQQAYDQYLTTAGWQPMTEEDQYAADPTADEKRLEAEKNQFTDESIPPPYAVFNNSYVTEEEHKHT